MSPGLCPVEGKTGGRGELLCGSSGLLPRPSTTRCPLGFFLQTGIVPAWGPLFFCLLSGALSRAAGQHQFLGLEEGDRREGRSCGGGFFSPSLDCYSLAPLLSRPGQTEDGSPFLDDPAPGRAVFFFPILSTASGPLVGPGRGWGPKASPSGWGIGSQMHGGSRC